MSTYYGYRCLKCSVSSEHWFNHGEAQLKEVLDNWLAVKQIRETNWIEIEILGCRGSSDEVFRFVEKHFEHGLLIEDEYGKIKNYEITNDAQTPKT